MTEVRTQDELRRILQGHRFVLVYVTGDNCGVCSAIKPRIAALLARYPALYGVEVNAHHHPKPAAQLSIFTIPAVLFFMMGVSSCARPAISR